MRFEFLRRYPEFLILFSVALIGGALFVDKLWFFAAVALIPFYAVLDRLGPRRALGWTALFVVTAGIVIGYPLLSFRSVQSAVPTDAQSFAIAGVILGYILSLAVLALLALLIPFILVRSRRWRLIIAPAGWVVFEFLAGQLSFDLKWFFAGEPLIAFLPLAVLARWGGSYGLSFLVIGFNIALYEGLKFFRDRRFAAAAIYPLLGTLGIAAVLTAGGWAYVNYFDRTETGSGPRLSVVVVQPGSFQTPERRGTFFSDLLRRTREVARPENLAGADLVIFPGNYFGVLNRDDFERLDVADALLGFKPDADSSLVGFSLQEGENKYQVLALVSPASRPQYAFKEHLFPLGDSIPAGIESISSSFTSLSGRYSAGRNAVLELRPGVKIGAISCSEGFVPAIPARLKQEGAKLLIISGSNDDFASPAAYKKSLRAARFRAIENNVFVVQAMKSGISAVIDPYGRVISSLDKDQKGVLKGEIPL